MSCIQSELVVSEVMESYHVVVVGTQEQWQ